MRILLISCFLFILQFVAYSQCQVYDGLGNSTANPVWVSCNGSAYTLYIQSPNNFGALTINWGDGSANTTVGSLVSPAFISHTYAAAIANYTVTITEAGAGGCVITGLVVMEEPVNASIQIPIGGVTQTCAPDELIFSNSSTDVSSNTTFVWDFGDGSPTETYGDTNAGQIVSHTYEQGTVNCVTTVTLDAENYCSFGNPTVASFNPIQIYDLDDAQITADFQLLCYPDTVVHFDNTTAKNCVPQGNTAQRFEYWNFGNYWGTGSDSIIDWTPFDPPAKPGYDIAFPGVGTYTIMMADSNMCGPDTTFITIQITDAPVADFSISTDSSCAGDPVTFTRLSTGGNVHLIDYGDGGGFQGFGATSAHVYNTAGSLTVTVVSSVGGGSPSCTDTTTLPIEILPSPIATANISPNGGCDSVTSVFINTSTGAASYYWQFGGGDTSTLQNPPTYSFTTVGQHIVTLTVTSNNGCIDSTQAAVNVYDTPIASYGALNVCEDELASFYDSSSVGYGGPVNSWTWSFGDTANTTSNLQNPTYTYADSGQYVVQLIASTPHCSDTISYTITVEPRPIGSFQESDSVGCSPLAVTFTNNSLFGVSYDWDFGDGNTSTQVSPVHSYVHNDTSDTFFIVTLTVYSAFGCVDSLSDTIQVLGNPVAAFSSNAALDCAPLNVQFSDSSISAVSWAWGFGDSLGSNVQNPSHVFENQTLFISNYIVTLTVTGANGCTDSTFETITVYPEPLFNFNIVPDSGCSPLYVQFPVAIGAVLYSWDFGDNTTSTGTNPSHTYVNYTTNNAIFTVTLEATSSFGCTDTVSGDVVVFPTPNASLTPNQSVGCQPLSINFNNTSTGGTVYNWDFGDGTQFSSNNGVENHVFTNAGNSTIVLNPTIEAVTDEGCTDIDTVEVQVYRKVVAEFSVNEIGCHPYAGVFTDASLNAVNWFWDFDDGFTSTIQNPTHTFINTGTTPITRDVTLEVTSVDGCQHDTMIQVTINPKPTCNFSIANSPSCENEVVSIVNNSTQNEINTWRFYNSGIPVIINDAQIDTIFENKTNAPKEFDIFLVVENSFGCKDSFDRSMTVYPEVIAEFIAFDEGCGPLSIDFTNLSEGGTLFEWNFGDGDISFMDEPTHVFELGGVADETFTITLTTTSPYGCEDSDTFDILVHPTPEPFFTATPFSQRFPDTTVLIDNLTPTGPWFYEWEFGDGNSDTNELPIDHSFSTWGEYRILLKVSSEYCEDTVSQRIIIEPPLPIAEFDTLIDDCAPVEVTFNNLSQYGVSFLWEFGDGATSSAEYPNYTYQYPGVYTVKLTVVGPGGETDFKEVQNVVTVRDQPTANFIYTPSEVSVPNPVVFINYSLFAESYLWLFGDTTTSTEENPQKVYTRSGEFYPSLVAYTEFGCTDTFASPLAIVALEVGALEVPNAFTPNPNGSAGNYYDPLASNNEVFFPILTGVLSEDYTMSIFNRWGELLFETHDVRQGWDGYYRDRLSPQDAYVWKVSGKYVNGQKFSLVGDVTLIR